MIMPNITILFIALLCLPSFLGPFKSCSGSKVRKMSKAAQFLHDNQRLYLIGMSLVQVGPPIRCMDSEFQYGTNRHVAHKVYYQQRAELRRNNLLTHGRGAREFGEWQNKTLLMLYTKETGDEHVELTVEGVTPPQHLIYQVISAKHGCFIIGQHKSFPNDKTTCMVWSPINDFNTLSVQCQNVLKKNCRGQYTIPSRSVEACPGTPTSE
uniref:Lipocalin n=1 Tax=Rhipicephalus appendiculatus TaxID=34631 RepID=A0A131YPW5_RHIAP